MKRQKKGIFTKFAQPFSKWWASFRAEVIVVPMDDPLEPIMSVNNDILTIRTGYHTRRNTLLLPLIFSLTIMSFIAFDDLWPNIDFYKEQAAEKVELRQKDKAKYERWLLESQKEGDVEKQNRYKRWVNDSKREIRRYMVYVNKEGSPTIFTYLESESIKGDLVGAIGNLVIPSVIGLLALLAWLLFLLNPRDAEIYFDRRRNVVYTWRKGRLGAAYFDEMGIKENLIGLNIYLQFENKKKDGYWPKVIVGIDAGKLAFHGKDDLTYLLAQLLAFMENGKKAVITGDSYQRAPSKYFLRGDDKKPDNFEQRLSAVLEASSTLVDTYENNEIKGNAL